jgi:hypothetical protein
VTPLADRVLALEDTVRQLADNANTHYEEFKLARTRAETTRRKVYRQQGDEELQQAVEAQVGGKGNGKAAYLTGQPWRG